MRKNYTAFPLDEPDPTAPNERMMLVPALQVRVGRGHQQTPRLPAIVDSGSPWCIFRADIGRYLNINIESGPRYMIGGVIAGVKEPMYFHKVKIFVEADWVIEVVAGFAEKLGAAGILGRKGFFDNFDVRFDHSATPPALEIERIHRA